jgi:5-methyltetrahydrofolate corrinoid/iron sulfur protein methyltransferase
MLIIGERLNGMFKRVKKAIADKNKDEILAVVQEQINDGAGMIDINVGTAAADQQGTMQWLVETVQEKYPGFPLAVDSSKVEVLEAGLKVCQNPVLINSTTAEDEKLEKLLGLAAEYKADILGLTLDENGIPSQKDERVALGAKILMMAMEMGLSPESVYLDPVVLPVKFGQDQCVGMIEAIRDIKTALNDPAPKTAVGLSNISNGVPKEMRSLVNRTYLVMCLAAGLDSAIVDPHDQELVNAMITAELLMNKQIYSDSFIKAYRAAHG